MRLFLNMPIFGIPIWMSTRNKRKYWENTNIYAVLDALICTCIEFITQIIWIRFRCGVNYAQQLRKNWNQ